MFDKDKQKTLLLCAVLVMIVAALYGQFLWNPILFDDSSFFQLESDGSSHVLIFSSFSLLELRSLPYATLAWTAQLFGLELIGFRIGNLALHAATVVAL